MLGAFNELLAINQVANFAWWNEDHNHYIDLRASIPLRRGALALGAAAGAETATTTRCSSSSRSSWTSAPAVTQWSDLQSIATARHEYYDHYNAIRDTIPKVVGTLPDKIEDPGPHRDLRDARPLLRADEERPIVDSAVGLPRIGGHRQREGPGDAVGDRAVRSRGGRDPRVRGDLAELDARVRPHRRVRLRRRRLAHARRDRRAASTASRASSAARWRPRGSRPAMSSRSTGRRGP